MNAKKLWLLLVPAVIAGVAYALTGRASGDQTAFRFVEVERGTVEHVVTSTGKLQATETVEVGTQVSGQLSGIFVDFNDPVRRGDLLARIDPTLLQQAVRASEASLTRNTAEMDQARRNLERTASLYEAKVATTSDVETARYQFDVAEASLEQARISVEQARRNLEYTEIRAPIDGVVIERAVDAGQTVAASMSAPVLFIIAEDLAEMEILATVDESDIGLIRRGQEVRFTVQAYPGETFRGEVSQVRLQSSVVENVVTYGVVIAVENTSGALLPGMTATVEFVVAREEDVLRVPNSALRFQPTEAMLGEAAPRQQARAGAGAAERARLYYLDEEGALAAVTVEKGLTDSQSTVVKGDGIEEGMRVVAGTMSGAAVAASNPFQTQSGNRPGGPPPM